MATVIPRHHRGIRSCGRICAFPEVTIHVEAESGAQVLGPCSHPSAVMRVVMRNPIASTRHLTFYWDENTHHSFRLRHVHVHFLSGTQHSKGLGTSGTFQFSSFTYKWENGGCVRKCDLPKVTQLETVQAKLVLLRDPEPCACATLPPQ